MDVFRHFAFQKEYHAIEVVRDPCLFTQSMARFRYEVGQSPALSASGFDGLVNCVLPSIMLRMLALFLAILFCLPAKADDAPDGAAGAWAALREGGCYLLLRHARTEPGTGDPAGLVVTDRATQRNLSEAGRAQARRIGETLTEAGIKFSATWSSPWFRCRDTADLISGGHVVVEVFGSFFESTTADRTAKSAGMRQLLVKKVERDNVLVVTHQVNITGLTGIVPSPGEGVVVRPGGREGFTVVGRVDFEGGRR